MDAHDVVFVACNVIALSGWVLLVGFPRARLTERVARTMAPALLIAAIYAGLVVVTLIAGGSEGDFWSLDGVSRLSTTGPSCSRAGSTTWRSTSSSGAGCGAARVSSASGTGG